MINEISQVTAVLIALMLTMFVFQRLYEFFFVPFQPPKRMRWADLPPGDREILEEAGYDREYFERGMEPEVIDYAALLPHERERIKQEMYRGLRAWDIALMRLDEAEWLATPMGQAVRGPSRIRAAKGALEFIESVQQANTGSEDIDSPLQQRESLLALYDHLRPADTGSKD